MGITTRMTLLILIAIAITSFTKASPLGLEDNLQWEKFKLQHEKVYPLKAEEEIRKDVFRTNLRKIEAHNEREEKGLVVMSGRHSPQGDMPSARLPPTCLP